MKRSLIPQRLPYYAFTKVSPSFALWYMIGFLALSYFFFLMAFVIVYQPYQKINTLLESFSESIHTTSPDLTITIRKGFMKTNYNRPYFWWVTFDGQKKLAFVVDDSASSSKITQYQSLALLTPSELVIRTPQNSFISFPLSSQTSLLVNKTSALAWFQQFTQLFHKAIIFLSVFSVLVFPILYICIYIVCALTVSTALYIFYRFRREPIQFGYILKLSVFAVTTPLLLYLIICLFFPFFLALPGIFLVAYLLFTLAAVHRSRLDARKEHTHPVPSHTTRK